MVGGEPLTIAQIAEKAGVSTATVSKVVNGRLDVAPDTRGLVEKVILQHGYRRQRRPPQPAPLVEVAFDVVGGEYSMEIIVGAERAARHHRLGVVVSSLQREEVPGRGWIEDVLARRPMGVISAFCRLAVAQREQLLSRNIPFVEVDPVGELGQEFPSVGASNWSGGLAATRHLLGLGHRRIGVVAGPADALPSRARLDGYRAAMDAARVSVDPTLIREGNFRAKDGAAHTRDMLAVPDPPTAIFACSDAYAIGVYQAAHELGVRIPEDLSVVGFDDIPPASWLSPALTTVRQPLADMAAEAVAMVVTLAGGEPLQRNRLELSTELIVRDSTASPRATGAGKPRAAEGADRGRDKARGTSARNAGGPPAQTGPLPVRAAQALRQVGDRRSR